MRKSRRNKERVHRQHQVCGARWWILQRRRMYANMCRWPHLDADLGETFAVWKQKEIWIIHGMERISFIWLVVTNFIRLLHEWIMTIWISVKKTKKSIKMYSHLHLQQIPFFSFPPFFFFVSKPQTTSGVLPAKQSCVLCKCFWYGKHIKNTFSTWIVLRSLSSSHDGKLKEGDHYSSRDGKSD